MPPPARSRRLALRLLALAALVPAVGGCMDGCGADPGAPPATQVFVVRHAEKDAGEDPPLSAAGQRRALALPQVLPLEELAAIYATSTRRTQETAAAVSAITSLPVTEMPPTDFAGLLERAHALAGRSMLVVGHSNTIPDMLAAMGVDSPPVVGEADYGDVFVVTVRAGAPSRLERRRFGDPPDAAAAADSGP
jgi:phosphohistidine phosphatase SixA